jgi:hypothetical protein
VLDCILFEQKGIPAVAIITEPFVRSGEAMAKTYGKADYGFAVLPHPIGNTEPVILKKWVEKIYPIAKRLLVER